MSVDSASFDSKTDKIVQNTITFIDKLDKQHQVLTSSPINHKRKHIKVVSNDVNNFNINQHKRIRYSQDLCGNE